MRNIILIYCNS